MTKCFPTVKIIPADDVIADLEREARGCEARTQSEPKQIATKLKEQANLLRDWITALKSGRWTSGKGAKIVSHASPHPMERPLEWPLSHSAVSYVCSFPCELHSLESFRFCPD